MQLHLMLFVLAAVCSCAYSDIIDDLKKSVGSNSQTGLDVNVGQDSAKVGVKADDGNLFYYYECSGRISLQSGFDAGCERKWKPLFYGLIAGGGVLAILLLTCCCCCCCCCKKKSTPGYIPVTRPVSTVILLNSEAPNPMVNATVGQAPKYDVQMLQA